MHLPLFQKQKTKSRSRLDGGNVLVMTLVIVGLVTLMLGIFMTMVSSQNSFTMRSFARASEIPMAEAGLEEAMAHLNNSTNRSANGWTLTNNAYVKQRTLGDGYFYACISTGSMPTVTCTGYSRIQPQNNYSSRVLRIATTNAPWQFAILAKDLIKMSGGSTIDSFNSSDPNYSSNGLYTVTEAGDQAKVGTLGTTTKIIDAGTGKIYGQVATAPGGTVSVDSSGAIGDQSYVNSGTHGGTVQTGHSRNDLNVYISDVGVPFTTGFFTPGPGADNGTNYTYLFSAGDWKMSTLSLSGGNAAIVTGKARIYVTGDVNISGSAYILLKDSSCSAMLYCGGKCTVSGMGVVNGANKASNFSIWGLPSCTQVEYSGSAALVGTIYAPQAVLKLSGSAGMSGAIVAYSVDMSGGASVHYDQALAFPYTGAAYAILSWTEL